MLKNLDDMHVAFMEAFHSLTELLLFVLWAMVYASPYLSLKLTENKDSSPFKWTI